MSNNINVFLFITLFSVLISYYDIAYSDSKICLTNIKNRFKLILYILIIFIHQLFVNNMYFCFFYNDIRINYLIVIGLIITILHWPLFNNNCIITLAANKLCNNDQYLFNDITKMSGIKKGNGKIMFYIFGFIILYNIYVIYKNK